MSRLPRLFALALVAITACFAAAQPAPVNPHASSEARALLAYIDSISGKGIVTGQHNYPNDGSKWTDRVLDLTGKYPGLFGEDFGFSAGEDKDSVLSRPAMIEEVKRQWQNGALIALTWHAVRPTDDEPVTFRDSVQGHLTDYEFRQLLTPGTSLYNHWCEQVDIVAGFLRQLRDAHVPVLFRPFHEVNGNWFWWGYRPGPDGGSQALYRQLYHRFVDVHHLDNLVWVWNVNAPGGNAGPSADYYPGAKYADIVSMDIYGEFKQDYYDSMLKLADGKPIALAEVGEVPSLDVLAAQPRWTYFMVWAGFTDPHRMEGMQAIYHASQAINRDDPRQATPLAAIRKLSPASMSPVPVSPDSGAEAKALLNTLAAAPGKAVLSGIELDPKSPAPAADATATTKPAIVSLNLDPATTDALLASAKQTAQQGQTLSLAWRPSSPTGGAAKSALTDYEWNDLVTPGTDLNKRWEAQVDEAAKTLHEIEKSKSHVLFNPYPEANGKDYWWAGRKGNHGSAALYRMLFERLTQHDGLHNLIWIWEAAPMSFGPNGPGPITDYFPSLLYIDALEFRVRDLNGRFPIDRFLGSIATGKPLGVEITGDVPSPDAFAHSGWSWFIVDQAPATPAQTEALQRLLAAPHIASAPVK
jgi:mannan endo-1,4-beta-mannosidase